MKGKHLITNSYGVYDAYKYYRKNKPKGKQYILSESQYFALIRGVNKLVVEEVLNKGVIKLPHRMGEIFLYKHDFKPYFKDGQLIINKPVNWKETLKLWQEDEESKELKRLIRHDDGFVYYMKLVKRNSNHRNKEYYTLKFNDYSKTEIKKRVEEGNLEAFITSKE